MENNIEYLKKEAKLYEREILKMLLEVSESFSNGKFTKQQRDETFERIDSLKEKVKDILDVISNINNEKKSKELLFGTDNNANAENINNATVIFHEKPQVVGEEISKEIENTEKALEDISSVPEEVSNDSAFSLENIEDKYDKDNELKVNFEENEKKEDIELSYKATESLNEVDDLIINDECRNDDSEIDRLDEIINETKKLNESITNFSKEIVIEKNENIQNSDTFEKIENGAKDISVEQDTLEPVPVLFGNNRVQNQMIIRKKSNGFSDKIRSLVFKIKLMLGGKSE